MLTCCVPSLLRLPNASPETRKNVISCCNCSDCAASSSAVLDNSSAEDAFRCVTASTCDIAWLICVTPLDCSVEAAATSCTRSAVFLIEGTSSVSSCPDLSATLTLLPANP